MDRAAKPDQTDDGCLATFSSWFRPKRKPLSASITPKPASTNFDDAVVSQNDSTQDSSGESKLWLEALEKTNDETRDAIKQFLSPSDDEVQIEELMTIVREREQKFKDETPRLKIGDCEIIWRDCASRVVGWMTDIGDIAIPFAPSPSSTVWSALKTHVSQCTDLIAILGCAEKVLRIVKRGKIYEVVYLQEPTSDSYLSTEGLRGVLVDTYQKSIELLAHAAGQLDSGGGMRFIHALRNPGEGDGLVQDLFKAEQKLGLAVQACEAEHNKRASAENMELLERLNEPLRYIDNGVSALLQDMEQKALLEALEYVSTTDIADQHKERAGMRSEGTCEWLLEGPKFERWESSSSSSILWLKGRVGTGKSTLTSKVVDRYRIDVLELMKESGGGQGPAIDEAFAFFYCSKRDATIKDDIILHALSSYVRQLATVPHYPSKMEAGLVQLCQNMKKNNQKFQVSHCQDRIQQLVNLFPRTTLILDALDECDKRTRREFIKFFGKLIKESKRLVRIFISSREEDDICGLFHEQDLFVEQRLVEITIGHSNQEDMKKYIDGEMEEIGNDWSDKAKQAVMKKLLEANDGMFRWTYLQMEQLKCFKSTEEVLNRLGRLPQGLNKAYEELYENNQGHDRVLLQRAVKWVKHANKPLTTEQLLEAIRVLHVGRDDKGVHHLELSEPLNESQLASICRHLIVKETVNYNSIWKFPHASVVEYFEHEHPDWSGRDAQIELAKLSLMMLIDGYSGWSLPELPEGEFSLREYQGHLWRIRSNSDPQDPRSSLQRYIKAYWDFHVRATQNQEQPCLEVSQLLRRFMIAEGEVWGPSHQFLQWYRHHQLRRGHEIYHTELAPISNPLFAVWAFGLFDTAKAWINFKVDVSQVNDLGLDALGLAAKYGYNELCRTLVTIGSDVNSVTRDKRQRDLLGPKPAMPNGESPLFAAVSMGHVACVETLLSLGANPDLDLDILPLCLSVRGFDTEIVNILLKYGANPNARCGDCSFQSPLLAAAHFDAVKPAERLIKAGAKLDVRQEGFGSLLESTAYAGSVNCLKLFIDHGLDLNAPLDKDETKYGSVLAAALYGSDSEETVRFLIEEARADPQMMLSRLPTPRPYLPWRCAPKARYLSRGEHLTREELWSIGFHDDPLLEE